MIRLSSVRPSRALCAPLALLAATALLASACGSSSSPAPKTITKTAAAPSTSSSPGTGSSATSTSARPSKTAKPAKPVHVSLQMSDGSEVGVGMPVIAYLSRPIKDAKAFSAATKASVNGVPVRGAWYFEDKFGLPGKPIEADFRLQNYWPGHARIHLSLPVKGLSAGPGLAYDNSLTLDFSTGAANISKVDDATHRMTVTSDGHTYGTFPVSLGSSATPTKRGIKVIMEKGLDISMRGPGYFDAHVKFTQRLTYGGEYLHSAPWNTPDKGGVIGRGDSSNGCTNLLPSDAERLFHFLHVGDVVEYPNASGPLMTLGAGYGDWNLSWGQWQTGGLYPTT